MPGTSHTGCNHSTNAVFSQYNAHMTNKNWINARFMCIRPGILAQLIMSGYIKRVFEQIRNAFKEYILVELSNIHILIFRIMV